MAEETNDGDSGAKNTGEKTGAGSGNASEAEAKTSVSQSNESTTEAEKAEAEKAEAEKAEANKADAEKAEAEKAKAEKADAEKAKAEKAEEAPDEYAAFDYPEDLSVDEEKLDTFISFAKERNLSQKDAQSLVDLHVETLEQAAALQQEKWDGVKKGWREETLADKSLHNKEGNADEAVAASLDAVKQLGGQELMDALELTGAGEHPAVVKAFHKLSKSLAQSGFTFGADPGDTRTRAQRLYPTMNKKE